MSQYAHPELLFFEGKPRVCPEDERSNQPPGPPLRKRAKQRLAPVGRGEKGQRKQQAEEAPQNGGRYPPAPMVVQYPSGQRCSFFCVARQTSPGVARSTTSPFYSRSNTRTLGLL